MHDKSVEQMNALVFDQRKFQLAVSVLGRYAILNRISALFTLGKDAARWPRIGNSRHNTVAHDDGNCAASISVSVAGEVRPDFR